MPKCPKCKNTFAIPSAKRADEKRRGTPGRRAYQNAYRRGMYDGRQGNPRKTDEHPAYGVAYDTAAGRGA